MRGVEHVIFRLMCNFIYLYIYEGIGLNQYLEKLMFWASATIYVS